MDVITIIAIGLVAGIFHQLVDRAKENDRNAFIRSAVVGAVSAWLAYLMYGGNGADENTIYLSVFVAGYVGDSFVLNVLERENLFGIIQLKNEEEE